MKPLTAAEIIAGRKAGRAWDVPEAALKELRQLVEYNDSAGGTNARFGREKGAELLRSYGVHVTRNTIDALCRDLLGRQSYARP